MTRKDAERQEAIGKLREWIKPGDTIYTILRHVSRSGMSRRIGVVQTTQEPVWLDYNVAKAIRERENGDGIVMRGYGMDMGFALVHALSYALFPDSFECVGKGCPSNDHSNGDRDYAPHKHSSGGYALRQRWL